MIGRDESSQMEPVERAQSLESVLQRLDAIVRTMESGAPSLDENLALFEEGVRASRDARRILDAAELRVSLILETEPHVEPDDSPPLA